MYHIAFTTFVRYDNISPQQFQALQVDQHKHQRAYSFHPQKTDRTIEHKYLVTRQFMTMSRQTGLNPPPLLNLMPNAQYKEYFIHAKISELLNGFPGQFYKSTSLTTITDNCTIFVLSERAEKDLPDHDTISSTQIMPPQKKLKTELVQ